MKKLFYVSNLLTLCLVLCSVTGRAQSPSITSGPVNDTVCSGTNAMFAVSLASDTLTPHFLWEETTDAGATWDTIANGGLYSGATTDTLMVFAADFLSGREYRLVVGNDSGSASSAWAVLVVKPLPFAGVISGPSNFCKGSNTTLTTTGTDGVWSSSNTAVATVLAGVVTGVAGGIDTIMYKATNTCGTDSAMHAITVDTTLIVTPVIAPSTVCVGSAIHFTNTNSDGVWSVTNDNAVISPETGYADGIAAGMDTAIYTVTNTCNSVSSSKAFTIESPLEAGTLSGPSIVCAGSYITLTPTEEGGLWLSSDASIATADAEGNVTGRGQGTATISYIFVNSCGSSIATETITVDRLASDITGSDSVGLGAYTTLSDSVVGGTWSSSDTSVAMVDAVTGVVSGHGSGTATISYMVTNTCGISWATIPMNVGPAPSAGTISGADTVCQGGTITLTPSVPGGTWSVTNANASVSAAGVVTGIIGETRDTVLYKVMNAFGSNTVKFVVYVNTPPVIIIDGPASIALGTAYLMIDTPTNGTWVSLDPSHAQFIGANTFVVTQYGNVNLVYTASNACGTSTDTFKISIPGGSTEVGNVGNTAHALNVYPNPNTGAFTLNITTGIDEQVNVIVTSILGQTVKELNVTANKATQVSLDEPAGIYFLKAATTTGNYSAKITIAK